MSLLSPNLARIRLIRKKLCILASVNPRTTFRVTRNRVQAYHREFNDARLTTDSFPFRLHLMFSSFLRSVSQRRNRVFAKSETRSRNTNVFLLSVKSRRPFSFTMKIEDGEDALPCSKKNSFPFQWPLIYFALSYTDFDRNSFDVYRLGDGKRRFFKRLVYSNDRSMAYIHCVATRSRREAVYRS